MSVNGALKDILKRERTFSNVKGHFLENNYFSDFFHNSLQPHNHMFFLATTDHSLKMVSAVVAKALERAAKRATRVAEADAGLREEESPRFPSKKKSEELEAAKESSRPDTQICKHNSQRVTLTVSEWNSDL